MFDLNIDFIFYCLNVLVKYNSNVNILYISNKTYNFQQNVSASETRTSLYASHIYTILDLKLKGASRLNTSLPQKLTKYV